ncbi:phosphohydrolase [Candidatus Bathyarchaeota archaeon ex4484_135]|nr:MAG: phosphohydrolase [Candidatus Bathyarchaeota archaeon ex4484_135]
MVVVSPELILTCLEGEPRLREAYEMLEEDPEVRAYFRMANTMAVKRMMYNDHGQVHARITAGSALYILTLLLDAGVTPTSVRDGICDLEDAKLITMMGAYLHDIGNAVHREFHHLHGCYIAAKILDRVLPALYGDLDLRAQVRQEVLHCIFSHDESVRCLSVEAGVVKVADGTDMAGGRARIPYRKGKVDIHSMSALAIRSVEIEKGHRRPVRITVRMDNPAGIFQVEETLCRKMATSGIEDLVEVYVFEDHRLLKVIRM